MLAGANIIYGLGMLEMGMTISYSQLLMDAEMAEMMLFSMDGIVVNDETLSVDVIKEVGPRSDFLAHMNTFENMYIQSKPKLIDRLTRDRWNEAGQICFLQEFGGNENRYDPYAQGDTPVFREEPALWF